MAHRSLPVLALSLAIGLVLGILGLWTTAKAFEVPIHYYDEGILLSVSNSILHGAVPHRDFYANYPPGIFLLIAGIWRVLGVSVTATRALGLVFHLAIAAFGGRIAARCIGRRFSWLAFGLIVLWLASLGVVPYAWLAGLAMALLFIELFRLAFDTRNLAFWLGSGFAWSALLGFRHDLFVYFNACLLGAVILSNVLRRTSRPPVISRSSLTWFAAGAAVPILIVWGPTLAGATVNRVVGDLFLEQVRHVVPARVLPLPPLWAIQRSPPALFSLPAFLDSSFQGSVALCLLGPVLAGLGWAYGRWLGLRDWIAFAMIGTLSIAVLPQMLGRTDEAHAVYAVAPALILASVIAEALALRMRSTVFKVVPALGVALVLTYPVRSKFPLLRASNLPRVLHGPGRYSGLHEPDSSRAEVLAFIAANSVPGEAIFVGTFQHRWISINEVDLYYLADRPGATRYTQFDPNLVNRAEVQQEMVSELEQKRTRLLVLSSCCWGEERNESARPGSSLLDEYIQTRYQLIKQVDHYRLLIRGSVISR